MAIILKVINTSLGETLKIHWHEHYYCHTWWWAIRAASDICHKVRDRSSFRASGVQEHERSIFFCFSKFWPRCGWVGGATVPEYLYIHSPAYTIDPISYLTTIEPSSWIMRGYGYPCNSAPSPRVASTTACLPGERWPSWGPITDPDCAP